MSPIYQYMHYIQLQTYNHQELWQQSWIINIDEPLNLFTKSQRIGLLG